MAGAIITASDTPAHKVGKFMQLSNGTGPGLLEPGHNKLVVELSPEESG